MSPFQPPSLTIGVTWGHPPYAAPASGIVGLDDEELLLIAVVRYDTRMNALADSLVYAVAYINCRKDGDDDADVGALESISGALKSATEEELDALAAAADRALETEKGGTSREEFTRCYRSWMEHMFGEGWIGNHRT